MSAGKGDTPRPVDGEKYRDNFDLIFRKRVNGKKGNDGKNGGKPK